MSILAALIAGGLLTFAMRFSFIYMLGRMDLPEGMRRLLRFVPAAVLSAIIAPELLLHSGQLDAGPGNARLMAGLLAILVAWWTKNTLITIVAGVGALLVLRLIYPV